MESTLFSTKYLKTHTDWTARVGLTSQILFLLLQHLEKRRTCFYCLNWSLFIQENSLKKKLKTKRKKKRRDIDKEGGKSEQEANDQEEEEEGDANEGEQDNSGHRERASSALIPERKSKVKRKTKVKEESLDKPKGPDNNQNPLKGKK